MNCKCLNFLILVIASSIFFSPQLFSQTNLNQQVIALISEDVMEFSDHETDALSLSQITFHSSDLLSLLSNYKVQTVQKAFPTIYDADTIKILEDTVLVKLPKFSRIYVLYLSSERDVDGLIQALSNISGVNYAEKNTSATPDSDDPFYFRQWYLNNPTHPMIDINAELAWRIFTGNTSTKIGIFDTGIEITHQDLINKTSGDGPYNTAYSYGHGTHVAGICAANTNNDVGIKGVNWNASILSRRIFDGYNLDYIGDVATTNKIIDAINSGASILNHSWGNYENSITLRLGFTYAYKCNVTSVASMGNDATSDPRSPAFFDNVIAVGAINDFGNLYPSGNWGSHIDVVAPGVSIYSTILGNLYGYKTGTSFSTPIVSGIASLLKGYNNNLTNNDIENLIKLSARDLGPIGWDEHYGTGLVDARKALDLIRPPYTLSRRSVSGGTDFYLAPPYYLQIKGVNGLPDGNYWVKRHEVRGYDINPTMNYNDNVWGNGFYTTGWSMAQPNFGQGYTGIVSYSLNDVTLKTYVYEVWKAGTFEYKGWWPCRPEQVVFNYTRHMVPLFGPPIPPREVSLVLNSNSNPVINWEANNDPDLTLYKIFRANGQIAPLTYTLVATLNAVQGGLPVTTWTDNNIIGEPGDSKIYYKLKAVDQQSLESQYSDSVWTTFNSNQDKINLNQVILSFELKQNFPNPFNPSTTFNYSIPEETNVEIAVYDLLGTKLETLRNEKQTAGNYEINWNASNYPSGVYFYQMKAGSFTETKKMLLMK